MKKYSVAKRSALAVLITFIQFLCIYAFLPPMVYNDDYLSEIALSGAYSGTIVSTYPFNNMLQVRGVGMLYRISSGIPWLSLLLGLTLIGSCLAVRCSAYSICSLKRIPLWAGELACTCFFFIIFFPLSNPLTFTMIGGICGTAAVCLAAAAGLTQEHLKSRLICSVLMLWLAYCIRAESGRISLCFWVLAVAVFFLIKPLFCKPIQYQRVVFAVVITAVLLGGCWGTQQANNALRKTQDARNISRWNAARSNLLDFHVLTYRADPAAFESIGWNEAFYKLANNWYLLDEKVDYDHLHALTSQSVKRSSSPSVSGTLNSLKNKIWSFSQRIELIPLIAVLLLLFLLNIWMSIKRWRTGGWLLFFFALCAVGGALLMTLYLVFIGRLLGRLFRMVWIPAVSCLFLSALFQAEPSEQAQQTASLRYWLLPALAFVLAIATMSGFIYTRLPLLAFVILLLGLTLFVGIAFFLPRKPLPLLIALVLGPFMAGCIGMSIFYTRAECEYSLERQQKHISEQTYVAQHPDDVFVSSRFINSNMMMLPVRIDLIHSICADKTNLFYTEDFLLFSDAYDEKLEHVGLDALNIDSYFTDNVYYIGNSGHDTTVTLLLNYMRTQYGKGVRAEVCEELDGGVAVYRFVK